MSDVGNQRDAVPELREGEVHVWAIPIDLERPEPDGGRPGLAADERARAARFIVAAPRRVFAQTRAALRAILGRYLDAPGPSLRFVLHPGGKPALAGLPELRFNVSHSGDQAIVAVARALEIGVDVERIAATRDLPALAARFFHPAERAAVQRGLEAGDASLFYAVWTRKEAVLKATGKGLRVPLSSFCVPLAPATGLARLPWPAAEVDRTAPVLGGPWALWTLPAAPGYRAALCAPPQVERVCLRRW